MACVPEAEEGDYVIVHAGIAISRVDPDEAQRVFEELTRLGDDDGLEDRGTMKYLDEYRDPEAARKLLGKIRRNAISRLDTDGGLRRANAQLAAAWHRGRVGWHRRADPRTWLSGVCDAVGSHRLCAATGPRGRRDISQLRRHASRAWQPPVTAGGQSRGRTVRIVYSPLDAVQFAKQHPDEAVVFFAVGFETTAPATALAVKQAARDGVDNFSLLVAHVRVQPAMEALVEFPDNRVQAFLAAGHVCTVMGYESYEPFVHKYKLPVVVTGFEPLDLLEGVLACVRQLEAGTARVENQYARSVRRAGNTAAQDIVREVYEACDRPWRGFGVIAQGGLKLRDNWRHFDARTRFADVGQLPIVEPEQCRSAEVLAGRIKPPQCSAFGTTCTPASPLGAPMVSSEGSCAAYYHYRRLPPTGQP